MVSAIAAETCTRCGGTSFATFPAPSGRARRCTKCGQAPMPKRELKPGGRVRVPSRSVEGVTYTVALALDGRLLCNCPASYNHLECWHLKFVREEMTTETAVAIRPVIPVQTAALVPSRADMDLIKDAAKMVFDGRIALPKEIDSPAKAAAIMLYGLELGLRPMTAIRNLYIVNGRVEPSAKLMAGMLMRSDSRARLVVLDCKVERDDKGTVLDRSFCKLRIVRPSRDIDQVWTVDWGQIRRAGLARDNNLLYPEDRLFYHCSKRLMRMYAPDIIEGLDDNAPTLASLMPPEAPPSLPSPEPSGLYNEGDEPAEGEYRDVDHETGEIHNAPALSTEAQQKQIKSIWNGEHFNAPVIFERYGNGSGGIKSLKLLTAVEADDVIALLSEKAACEHEAKMDEQRSLLVCGKCGVPLEGPDAVQQPAMPMT